MVVLSAILLALGSVGLGAFVALVIVVMVIAASRRAEALGADEMRRSRPDE